MSSLSALLVTAMPTKYCEVYGIRGNPCPLFAKPDPPHSLPDLEWSEKDWDSERRRERDRKRWEEQQKMEEEERLKQTDAEQVSDNYCPSSSIYNPTNKEDTLPQIMNRKDSDHKYYPINEKDDAPGLTEDFLQKMTPEKEKYKTEEEERDIDSGL